MPTRQEIEAQFKERMLTFGYEVRGPLKHGVIDLRTWIVATGKLIAYGEILHQLDGPDPLLEDVEERVVVSRWGGVYPPAAYYEGHSVHDGSCEECYDEDADEYYECNCMEWPDDPDDRAAIQRFRSQASELEWVMSNWINDRWEEFNTALRLADATETTPFGDTIVSTTR